MSTKLQQFRKEESELFNYESGEAYTGITVSTRQLELMRDTINELNEKLETVYKQKMAVEKRWMELIEKYEPAVFKNLSHN